MTNTLHLKILVIAFAAASTAFAFQPAKATPGTQENARWEQHARAVNIIRDDWGIAHVYGKTDADTVFGAIYAQAEDDVNRVETNYLNSMGRLAEAEGESKIYQDLRMKLFIDPK
jgi:acyl-homoserine-lactone acylase